jgi:hypothetical protein
MRKQTVQIICRNQIYNYSVLANPAYQEPRVINWRYQVPGKEYNQLSIPDLEYQKPRAINWRWQSNKAELN